ncbi:hypothetical protein L9F63_027106, partial [Diploptera punctata]
VRKALSPSRLRNTAKCRFRVLVCDDTKFYEYFRMSIERLTVCPSLTLTVV